MHLLSHSNTCEGILSCGVMVILPFAMCCHHWTLLPSTERYVALHKDQTPYLAMLRKVMNYYCIHPMIKIASEIQRVFFFFFDSCYILHLVSWQTKQQFFFVCLFFKSNPAGRWTDKLQWKHYCLAVKNPVSCGILLACNNIQLGMGNKNILDIGYCYIMIWNKWCFSLILKAALQ